MIDALRPQLQNPATLELKRVEFKDFCGERTYSQVYVPEGFDFVVRYVKPRKKSKLKLHPVDTQLWRVEGDVTSNIIDAFGLPVSSRQMFKRRDAIVSAADVSRIRDFGTCRVLPDDLFCIDLTIPETGVNRYFKRMFDISTLRRVLGIDDINISLQDQMRKIPERRLSDNLLESYSAIWVEPVAK
jgi:hypothetical protein